MVEARNWIWHCGTYSVAYAEDTIANSCSKMPERRLAMTWKGGNARQIGNGACVPALLGM